MSFENPVTFVRSLKGAPASVLWAFFFTRQTMTALELQEWTGYKGDNLTVALRLLVNLGWLAARSSRGPWCLVEGRQLPLMSDSDLIGVRTLVSSSSATIDALPSYSQEEEQEAHEPDLIGVKADCVAACLNAGIGEPTRGRLSRLEHVTPEFIVGHVKQAKEQGHGIGTAVYRIENNWTIDPKYLSKSGLIVDVRTKAGKLNALRNRQ